MSYSSLKRKDKDWKGTVFRIKQNYVLVASLLPHCLFYLLITILREKKKENTPNEIALKVNEKSALEEWSWYDLWDSFCVTAKMLVLQILVIVYWHWVCFFQGMHDVF